MKPVVKAPGPMLLKLRDDGPLSSVAFNFILSRYTEAAKPATTVHGWSSSFDYGELARNSSIREGRVHTPHATWLWVFSGALVGRCRLTLSNPRRKRLEVSS
jgi:hypothetical protein